MVRVLVGMDTEGSRQAGMPARRLEWSTAPHKRDWMPDWPLIVEGLLLAGNRLDHEQAEPEQVDALLRRAEHLRYGRP